MNAIIVDDEPLVGEYLRKELEYFPDIEVLKVIDCPLQALEFLKENNVDIVFTDIRMPKLNGMELAEEIYSIAPNAEIVFVTGYADYAVNAHELDVMDFLMKPVEQKRLKTTINRIRKEIEINRLLKNVKNDVTINFFGKFEVFIGDTKLLFKGKKQEEFLALLAHYENGVKKETIEETLWPNLDSARAGTIMRVTIYRLRNILKNSNISIENGKSLCCQLIYPYWNSDVNILEKMLSSSEPITKEQITKMQKIYKDGYMAINAYDWARDKRAEWNRRVAKYIDVENL
ncbi:MAG: response regulator [Patescibacteria group bacterium]|jgi:two-component SAPR family response regulator